MACRAFLGGAVSFLVLVLLSAASPGEVRADARPFIRGDTNDDGGVSLADVPLIYRQIYEAAGERVIACLDAADVNDDQQVNITDLVSLIGVIFNDLPDYIPQPFPLAGPDPVEDDVPCAEPFPPFPIEGDWEVRLGRVLAEPGGPVEIPIILKATQGMQGLGLLVEHDPALFTPEALSFEGTRYAAGFRCQELNRELFPREPEVARLAVHAAEGLFSVSILNGIHLCLLPPGEELVLAHLEGTVSAGAAPGSEIALAPSGRDHLAVTGIRLRNELMLGVSEGSFRTRYDTVRPRTAAGGIQVLDPASIRLRRGDASGDSRLDISDPIFALSFLFTGGDPPACPDALDANDDGALNIADPVALLSHLFTGPPVEGTAPLGACAPDANADGLGLCRATCGGEARE